MPTGPDFPHLDRRTFLRVGALGMTAAAAALAAGCGDGPRDPGVPPLPGGNAVADDAATWRVRGNPLPAPAGPAPDLTVAVTDLLAVEGQRIGAGNPAWLGQAAAETATAESLDRLLAGGAVMAGIAQTTDFGFGHSGVNAAYGTPPNPAAPGRVPGGSTSGAATAVARGIAKAGIGPDTTGSVRIPAAYQGLYGFGPTLGAVSTAGMLPLSRTFDTLGWLAADAATVAAVGDLLLPRTGNVDFDAAVTSPGLNAVADHRVQPAIRDAHAQWRRSALPTLTDEDFDIAALPDWYDAVVAVQGYEAWQQHGGWVSTATGTVGDEARANFLAASRVSEATYLRSVDEVRTAGEEVRRFLGSRVLLLPTTGSPAPSRADDPADIRLAALLRTTGLLTTVASIAGLPTATVPVRTADGAPVGLSLVGPAGRDRDVLALAERVAGTGVVARA
ncbi:amidase family protein [Rhodococcus sp. SGAir0479]|uniref:amidase family protein n=1 Tax=Rhodococcus sp. SGAir0479 TaxID=2567884 RepID=UPI0010CCD35E|nr:amidase family protein [Rhodococcus sp. SGAir0479]QCQ90359.1 amidase [Rhodococcus sp. SGAir0479]